MSVCDVNPATVGLDGTGNTMKNRSLSLGFLLVLTLGCTGGCSDSKQPPQPPTQSPCQPAAKMPTAPAAKQVRVTGIGKMNFANGDSALVLNYETDIPIEDKESLRKEVDTIWESFRKDVEKAQLKSGVIRATHYEGSGFLRQGNGYGFVFTQGDDGKWQLLSR